MPNIVEKTCKLPSGWDAKANNGKGKVISEETKIQVPEFGSVEDVISHYEGEANFLAAVNGFVAQSAVQNEYALRLAKVKPSDLSLEKRIERAISSMVKTGMFSIDEARTVVLQKAKEGKLD